MIKEIRDILFVSGCFTLATCWITLGLWIDFAPVNRLKTIAFVFGVWFVTFSIVSIYDTVTKGSKRV